MFAGGHGTYLALAAGGALLAIAGCGSSSSTTTSSAASTASSSSAAASSSSSAASGAATIDSCLVGKWTAASTSGSTTIGTDTPSLSGGDGEVLVISSDGSFTDDYAAAKPITGSSNGHQYAITTTGKSTGTATTSAGKVTISVTDTSAITQTVTQDGTSLGSQHPPTSQTAAYACQTGSFTVTSSGVVTTYSATP